MSIIGRIERGLSKIGKVVVSGAEAESLMVDGSTGRSLLVGVLVGGVLLVGLAGPASALAASPWWHLNVGARPSDLQAGSEGQIVVTAINLGEVDVKGGSEPVKIADKLPAGLSVTKVEGYVEEATPGGGSERVALACTLTPLQCGYTGILAPYRQLQVLIDVDVAPGARSGEVNEATISGGEAPSVSASRGLPVDGGVPFGLEAYEMDAEEQGGGADTQAGSHPFQLTTAFTFDQSGEPGKQPALVKDLRLELPAGLVDNPTPFPRCTLSQFSTSSGGVDECPAETALGVASVTVDDPTDFGPAPVTLTVPVFDLEPTFGEPARFGFDVENVPVLLDASVRTGTDYGITLTASNIPQTMTLIGADLTFWGVPGEPRHDNSRGWSCVDDKRYREIDGSLPPCAAFEEAHPPPLLTLPVLCAVPPETVAAVDSWTEPGVFGAYLASAPLPALTGCNRLPFSPSIEVAPDDAEANTPTGFAVQLQVPQQAAGEAVGLAASDVKDATITLPLGMQLNPSIEADSQGCSTSEIGFTGFSEFQGVGTTTFTPGPAGGNLCPEASKIATAEIDTPLLAHQLEGAVYLAARQDGPGPFEELENQPGFVVGMYIVAEDPTSGVLVKIPATLTRDQASGQLVMRLEDVPQLHLEDIDISFFGKEPGAPFSTPVSCGSYMTTASFTPWSGDAATTASSSFEINTGPDGSGPAGCSTPNEPGGGNYTPKSGEAGGGPPASLLTAALSTRLTDSTPVTATTPLLTITASKLVMSRGRTLVPVACRGTACRGSIALTTQDLTKNGEGSTAVARLATLVLATGSFSVAEGKSQNVVLRPKATGKKLLSHANKHHPIAAKLIVSVKGGKTMAKSVLVV